MFSSQPRAGAGGLHGDAAGEQSWWAPRRDSQENPWGQSSPAAEPAPGGVLNTPTQPGSPKSADSGVGALSPGESGRELRGGRGRPGGEPHACCLLCFGHFPCPLQGPRGRQDGISPGALAWLPLLKGGGGVPAGGCRVRCLQLRGPSPPSPQSAHENGHMHTVTHAHRLTPRHPHM